ncbi:MAG: sigma factor-like helix-turn-helix DNA-binding protein [Gordonibacter pamelaeae]
MYLHYYEGYSIREIAKLTGRSESAVSAHLSRGRAKLRTMLEGAYCEQGV